MRVLVVEDAPRLANWIAEGLRDQRIAVDIAYDGHEAESRLNLNPYDVVVLDRDLPGIHGDTICQMITESDEPAMILMLTAAGAPEERVRGLALGADDYLTKPFNFSELVLRVRGLARRRSTARSRTLRAAGIELDPTTGDVTRGRRTITLTAKECAVLESLSPSLERPLQPGFQWRRGLALSVVGTTGHLPIPRRWRTRVSRGGLSMTKDARFKRVVRRHAEETGQRYTEALTDLEGLGSRMHHEPAGDRLLVHLRDRYGIDAVAATKLSVHKSYVFRVDRNDGSPWIARAFPPSRPRAGVEGDAAILRFLEREDYPAERLAVEDAVSDFDGSAVLVTRLVEGVQLPDGAAKFAMMGELLGRLHALPHDDSVGRPGGASGEDPRHEGNPRQDLLAALSFLDAVDTKVPAADRERFERLRAKVRSADDGHGLPEALLHGNLLHAPDHAVLSEQGPIAINWKASGRGPRLADFAYLIWGTGSWNPRRLNQECIDAAVNAYRRHVEPADDELDRLEEVMYIRTLYLVCFGYRRAVTDGVRFREWGFIYPPDYYSSTAAATRAAFRR